MENTLVAALGFEPTGDAPDDGATVLLDDGTSDGRDWSNGADYPGDDHEIDLHATSDLADGFEAAHPASPTTAEAADAMTPPKGKGKGPQSFRRSSRARPVPKPPPMPDESSAVDSGADDSTRSLGGGNGSDALMSPSDIGVSTTTNGQTDVDPADDDFDLDVSSPLATSDATAPIPAGLFQGSGADRGAHSSDPPPPTIDDSVEGPAPAEETLVVDGLSLDAAPPPVDEPADTDPPPPIVDESPGLFEAGPPPSPDTIIADAPPANPPAMNAIPTAPPMAVPVVESAAPVTSPPPPIIGDPDEIAAPVVSPNGSPGPDATAEISIAARSGTMLPSRGGEIAAKVPQLLDQGLLKRTRRVRARKVRRVVRHIDPWSVLTFSVLFFLCLFAALLLASVLVWNAAVAAGTIENIESFIREIGDYQTYEINGDVVFRAAMVIAGILTLAASVMLVLLVVVFNLISDLVGGIRVTVVEEETVRVRRRNQ